MFKKRFLFLIPIVVFLYFILDGINLPYVGPNATNFSVYSLISHNFNKFGYITTGFAPLISISKDFPQNPEYFFHHPTLLEVVQSLLFRLFGEGFWVGRLTVILFSFGSLILSYFIGKELINKKFGYVALAITALIPASTLFGKLIGQEPLVIFFIFLLLYSTIKYLKSNKPFFFYLCIASIVLGVLSDWPMVIFALCLTPIYLMHKKGRAGILLILAAILTAVLFVVYTAIVMEGFTDLKNAIGMRSINGMLSTPLWPIRFLITITTRTLIYFNPIFLLLPIFFLINYFKRKKHELSDQIIFCLFIFAIIYLLLYMQAIFSHPYLIHYLLAFIVFSSSSIVLNLLSKKRIKLLMFGTIFSLIYLCVLNQAKNEQTYSNIWRYNMAKEVARIVPKYETVIVNGSHAVNPDILWYPFEIDNIAFDWKNPYKLIDKHNFLVFSCEANCNIYYKEFAYLKSKYNFIKISSNEAEAFVFYLKEVKDKQKLENMKSLEEVKIISKQNKQNYLIEYYRSIRSTLNVPQI